MALGREVKVGAFVLAGLALTGWIVMMIGAESNLFDPHVEYKARFDDVVGLKAGAPVSMGGVNIGTVERVGYSKDPNDMRLYVHLTVVEDEARRIREGSTATIEGKGLLGDKMLLIHPSKSGKQLPAGGLLKPGGRSGFSAMMDQVETIGSKTETVMGNLEKVSGTLADDKFRRDVAGTMKSLNGVLRDLNEGKGYAGRLLKDDQEAEKLSRTLTNLERSSAQLERFLAGLNQAVHRVNHGPGFVHEVIYGDKATRNLDRFGGAAEEVALALKGIREGDGIAHAALYGDAEKGNGDVMGDLKATTKDLRAIVHDVREGKGTIGRLLVDPSVYDDLKLLLGNVQRNRTLRALVRYSIKRDEKTTGPARVEDPSPPEPPPSASGSRVAQP